MPRGGSRVTPAPMSKPLPEIPDDQEPTWPPPAPEKKRGKATRVMNFNPNNDDNESAFLHSRAGRPEDPGSITGNRAASAARRMANAPSAMTKLVDRTMDDNTQWSPGKKPLAGPVSDVGAQGYNVVRPEPLVIRGKVRRGHQNNETTDIITREIHDRETRRKMEADRAECSRPFHSFFSQQPLMPKGTAHVKPPCLQHPVFPSYTPSASSGGGAPPASSSSCSINASGHTAASSGELPALNNSSHVGGAPPGLPGVGQVDAFRTRHALGKKQILGAHTLTSLVNGQTPLGHRSSGTSTPMPEQQHQFHQKLPDGSRGLRVAPQRHDDQVRDNFAADPALLMRRDKFVTTSSSIGNPEMRGYVPSDIIGNTRAGPNVRHFLPQQSSAFPPVGTGGVSANFRSNTPFPLPTSHAMAQGGRSRSSLR